MPRQRPGRLIRARPVSTELRPSYDESVSTEVRSSRQRSASLDGDRIALPPIRLDRALGSRLRVAVSTEVRSIPKYDLSRQSSGHLRRRFVSQQRSESYLASVSTEFTVPLEVSQSRRRSDRLTVDGSGSTEVCASRMTARLTWGRCLDREQVRLSATCLN